MAKKFYPATNGTEVYSVEQPAHSAPTFARNPMRNSPNQNMPAAQPEAVNYTHTVESMGVRSLGTWLNRKTVVQTIPIEQSYNVLQAPERIWNRNRWQTPMIYGRQERMPMTNLQAPPRTQSVPGQFVTQRQVTISKYNQLARTNQQLRSPGINENLGGDCDGD